MITIENIQTHIPPYLTPDQKKDLVEGLKDYKNRNIYTTLYPTDLLQGDGWSSIEIVRFLDGARDKIRGVLLSNSCDINPANTRDFSPRIAFAPLVRLQDYQSRLMEKGTIPPDQIQSKIGSIKDQLVTSIFYLPQGGALDTEYIAILDDIHTIPLAVFQAEAVKSKLFTFNMLGFYLFLIKLSIHFCRFQENLARG